MRCYLRFPINFKKEEIVWFGHVVRSSCLCKKNLARRALYQDKGKGKTKHGRPRTAVWEQKIVDNVSSGSGTKVTDNNKKHQLPRNRPKLLKLI